MGEPEVDYAALNVITTSMARVARGYLGAACSQPSRTRVRTVLKSLACMAAWMIAGTGTDRAEVRAWFDEIVTKEMETPRI